jgi:hypothetical protein
MTDVQDLKYGLVYPTKELAPLVEEFINKPDNIRQMTIQGWLIANVDTDVPDNDYIRGKCDTYYRIEADNEFWEKIGGNPNSDETYDALARKLGVVVDKHGVVRGFNNFDLVLEYNAHLPKDVNKKREEDPQYIAEVTAIVASNMYYKFYNGGEGVEAGRDGVSGASYAIAKMVVEILKETAHIKDWDAFMMAQPQMGWGHSILELAEKKFKEKYMEKKFKITILRTSFQWAEVVVEAESRQAAIIYAENNAGNYDTYKEKDANYSIEIVEETK